MRSTNSAKFTAAVCGTPLANGLLCWLLLLCFAKETAKMVAMVLLMLCFESLSMLWSVKIKLLWSV